VVVCGDAICAVGAIILFERLERPSPRPTLRAMIMIMRIIMANASQHFECYRGLLQYPTLFDCLRG
jgi:hypothetical protein